MLKMRLKRLLLLATFLAGIYSLVCDSACLTCNGILSNNCLTCASGLFLMGSNCIVSCPYKTMPSTRVCLTVCPQYYVQNTYNGYCEACQQGCVTCDLAGHCYDWGTIDSSNTILDYLALWIVLSVLVLILMAVLLWKLCCSSKSFEDKMQEEVIDHKRRQQTRKDLNYSTESFDARWVQKIDDLHLSKIQSRRAKNREGIQGIGRELSNI